MSAPNCSKDTEMNGQLAVAKQALRKTIGTRLARVPQASVHAQSELVLKRLLKFKPYINAARISVYLSMPNGEIQTDGIVRHALGAGKEVFVPYLYKPVSTTGFSTNTLPSRIMDMVALHSLDDYESLKPDKWGIPSIDPSTVDHRQRILLGHESLEDNALDLILMPGVAFEKDGHTGQIKRLGHGKGFYDFFLSRYAERATGSEIPAGKTLLVALALSEQILSSTIENVPVGRFDHPLSAVIIGDGEMAGLDLDEIDA